MNIIISILRYCYLSGMPLGGLQAVKKKTPFGELLHSAQQGCLKINLAMSWYDHAVKMMLFLDELDNYVVDSLR